MERKGRTELITGLGVEVAVGSSQGELNLYLCLILYHEYDGYSI